MTPAQQLVRHEQRRSRRLARRERLEALKARPAPWTDAEWREWAAVAAADVLDRGYARLERDDDGNYLIDRAFSVAGRTLVVGPGWHTFTREVGSRAASYAEEVK